MRRSDQPLVSPSVPLPEAHAPHRSTRAPGRVPAQRLHSTGRNPLLHLPIAQRLVLGFLIPALIASLALGTIGVQSIQLLAQESLFYQGLLHTYTSLTTARDVLQQMDTAMEGTLNDAFLPQPSSETLREDQLAVRGFSARLETLLNKDIQPDALDRHADLSALFTQAGHGIQIGEQRSLLQETQRTWQAYRSTQEQVLEDIAAGALTEAHALQYSQAELNLTSTLGALERLTEFDARLVTSVGDATTLEVHRLLLIIGLAGLGVLLGIGLVGWLVSSTLVRRLQELRSVVQSIERGQLSARLAVVGRDEIAAVSLGVNAMLDTLINAQVLEKLHQELQSQHEALNSAHAHLNEANARLEALATTDTLTALPNHRSLVAALDQELERARRYARSCTILFLDIDHFKALNDGYGHASGDCVLQEFAGLLRSHLRGIDTAGRWGGEEFVAILPEMTVEEAQIFAEAIRVDVAAHLFSVGGGIRLTCSLGVARYPTHASGREELMHAADQAMYAAKRLGRDQVRRIDDPLVQALLLEHHEEGGREESALVGIIAALTRLMEAHDPSSAQHSLLVSELLPHLLQNLGLPAAEGQMIALAGRLHDIGKIAIPARILHKPGKLTEEEWAVIRTHAAIGAEVVSSVPVLRPLAPMIRAHHERWDGQGYPDQLAGKAIPFGARILAVVNAYTAMTVDRPYQQARSSALSLAELRRCAGSQFDPEVVDVMERLLLSEQLKTNLAGIA